MFIRLNPMVKALLPSATHCLLSTGPLEELVRAQGFRGHEGCRPQQYPFAGGMVVLRREDRHVALPLHHPRRGLVRRAPPHH